MLILLFRLYHSKWATVPNRSFCNMVQYITLAHCSIFENKWWTNWINNTNETLIIFNRFQSKFHLIYKTNEFRSFCSKLKQESVRSCWTMTQLFVWISSIKLISKIIQIYKSWSGIESNSSERCLCDSFESVHYN